MYFLVMNLFCGGVRHIHHGDDLVPSSKRTKLFPLTRLIRPLMDVSFGLNSVGY